LYVRSISGSLVSIAMSGEMKANPSSGRIWNLLATDNLNIKVVQIGKLIYTIFLVAPKIGGPVRPNTSNMPIGGPGNQFLKLKLKVRSSTLSGRFIIIFA